MKKSKTPKLSIKPTQSPNVKIDADLAYELSVYAAKTRTTMKAVAEAAVREYIDSRPAA
jgi:predicted transcriptional regulator